MSETIKKIEINSLSTNENNPLFINKSDTQTFLNITPTQNLTEIQNVDVNSFIPVNNKTINLENSNKEEIKINNNKENNIYKFQEEVLKCAATVGVGYSKVSAGCGDILESITDGIIWTGGKIVEGTTYAVAQGAGLFNNDTEKSIMDWREGTKNWFKESIAVNNVDNLEDSLYNTEIGRKINNYSYLKYDSETANTIENVSKIGGEIVAATAATIATGGAASPTLVAVVGGLGFAAGAGEQSQKTYQSIQNTTGAQEAGIFFSGLESATRWYAYGRLGAGLTSTVSQIRNIASHGKWTTKFGTSDTISGALKTIIKTRRHRNTRKILMNSAKDAGTSFIDMSNGVFGTLADSLNRDNVSAAETGGRIAIGLVQNIIINTGVNSVDYLGGSLRTLNFIDSLDKRVISLIKTLIKTADAAEDSGVVPLDAYDIGEDVVNNIKERDN